MSKARQVEALREARRAVAQRRKTNAAREAEIRAYVSSPTATGVMSFDDMRFLLMLIDRERV